MFKIVGITFCIFMALADYACCVASSRADKILMRGKRYEDMGQGNKQI